jgi:nickel/cobalt transporter (NicO) family protein
MNLCSSPIRKRYLNKHKKPFIRGFLCFNSYICNFIAKGVVSDFTMLLLASFLLGGGALALGIMHALEPGHGKSVIAAYMAGNKGGIWHIVVLGLSVALSHTGSILIISLLLNLVMKQFSDLEEVHHVFELISSLLIIGVGLFMIYRHWKTTNHEHSHGHTCCDHDHHLGEGHKVTKKESYKFMAILGLSSGIIPCPTALATFLSAGAVGHYTSAFGNIVLYSLGIAITLMAIGLVTLYAGKKIEKHFENKILRNYIPLISAAIVLGIGFFTLFGFFTHQH